MKRFFPLAFASLAIIGLIFSWKWVFKEYSGREVSSAIPISDEAEQLREVLYCTLDEHLDIEFEDQSKRMIDFIYRELAAKFTVYNITKDLEKIHFLAQAMDETENFLFTIEKARSSVWRSVFRLNNFPEGNCQNYLSAIDNNKSYFDDIRRRSRLTYRATFRGRGLHQLTHCANYLGFFYHKAAQRINNEQSNLMRTYFYDPDDNLIETDNFCGTDLLRHVSLSQFERVGLPPLSADLINNFENTVNQLSLPCHNKTGQFIHQNYQCPNETALPCNSNENFKIMDNLEFLVDTALWHWKKCQRLFQNELDESSGNAVAVISYCIRGLRKYRAYTEDSCNPDLPVLRDRGILSYCNRLRNFRILEDCFRRHPKA